MINKTKRKPRRSPLSNVFELRKEIAHQKLRQGGMLPRVKSGRKSRDEEVHVY